MRLTIDETKCVGHGLCYMNAPRLVEPDESGFGQIREGMNRVPSEDLDSARRAESNCPENAVMFIP